VVDGGKFDGALGIIAGIAAVKAVLLEVGGRQDVWRVFVGSAQGCRVLPAGSRLRC